MLLLSLLLQAADPSLVPPRAASPDRVAAMVARYRERTRAEVPCETTGDSSEIVVCARRDADHYRVPFSIREVRDLPGQRMARLTQDTSPPCGETAFFFRCGMVGVSMTMNADGTHVETPRERAP